MESSKGALLWLVILVVMNQIANLDPGVSRDQAKPDEVVESPREWRCALMRSEWFRKKKELDICRMV